MALAILRNPTYLQHLDEGNTQVEVCQVTTDQTQTEHDTNGHNGAAGLCEHG